MPNWPLLLLLAGVLLVLGPWARSVGITTDIGQEKSYLGGMNAIAMECIAALLCDRLSRVVAICRGSLYAAETAGWVLIVWMNIAGHRPVKEPSGARSLLPLSPLRLNECVGDYAPTADIKQFTEENDVYQD
jgi:hypothetical protein